MKIFSWNVNGIRSVFKKSFMCFIKEYNPDVLCLQEIKALKEQLPSAVADLGGYYVYVNSSNKRGYSGTMVLSKQQPKKIELGMGLGRFDSEGRIMILNYGNFVLINLYLPHGGRDKLNLKYKMESYDFLINYLRDAARRDISVLLVGDFNIAKEEIDLARPRDNKNNIMFTEGERKKIHELLGVGFVDCFRNLYPKVVKYSWWPYMAKLRERNVGWRIDYSFANKQMLKMVKDSFVLNEVHGSDHCPVGVEIDG